MSDEDLNTTDFSHILSKLPEGLPISDEYDACRPGSDRLLTEENWYSNLKQSMVSWYEDLESLDGSAHRRRSLEARVGWDRSMSPQGMLWVTEALDEDIVIPNGAVEKTNRHKRLASQYSIVCRSILWARIVGPLATHREETQGYFKKGVKSFVKGTGSKLTGWLSGRRRGC